MDINLLQNTNGLSQKKIFELVKMAIQMTTDTGLEMPVLKTVDIFEDKIIFGKTVQKI